MLGGRLSCSGVDIPTTINGLAGVDDEMSDMCFT